MRLSQFNPTRLTPRHLLLAAPIYLLILKGFIFPLPLLDFWWHLKMGELILGGGSIPRTDLFSFTAAGETFVVQNWLSEIILFLTYKLGDFPLLIFFNTLLLVFSLIPIYYLCRKSSSRFWPPLFAAALASVCMYGNLRPQNFSFLFFALFYLLLDDYRFKRRDRLWLLPVLMVLWVNIHGGFVLGLILIGIYQAPAFVSKLLFNFHEKMFDRKLLIVQILSILATFANPEGFRIYEYIYTVLRDPSSQQFVVEWLPPAINNAQGIFLFFLPFFTATLVLILVRCRIDPVDLYIYLVFSFFGFSASRNSIYFLFAIAPIVARYMPAGKTDQAQPDREPDKPALLPANAKPSKQAGILNLVFVCAALIAVVIHSPWIKSGIYDKSLLEANTPIGAMDFIDKNSLEGNIFHPQIFGDYLIWRLWPKQHSFIDGRVHLFGESFIRYYQRILRDSNWEELLKKFDIRYLLLCKEGKGGSPEHMINTARSSPSWTVLHEDEVSVLFERR
jgi:hypothetical protein